MQPAARSEDQVTRGITYGSRDVQKRADNDVDLQDRPQYWTKVGRRDEENDVDLQDRTQYWTKAGKRGENKDN